jgi:cob(I)alamin adenosyltransferase
MKIYTKTGDKGMTGLLGGTRVPKHHIRIESYGTIDELNAFIGQLRDHHLDTLSDQMLELIQNKLFIIGSGLASDPAVSKVKIPVILENDVLRLETEMDRMNEELPEMRHFILPGGHPAVSACHIVRCVCRRAERNIVHLSELEWVDPFIIQYMNRLSDYLFVLARMIGKQKGSDEIIWKSGI